MLKQSLDEYKQFYLDLHKTLAQTTSSMLALEERLINQEKTSYDGTLLWSLTSVRQKICESLASRQKSFFSPVFYTSRDGYRLTWKDLQLKCYTSISRPNASLIYNNFKRPYWKNSFSTQRRYSQNI